MPRWALLGAVIASAVALGTLVAFLTRDAATGPPKTGRAHPTASGRTPAFYLEIGPEERLQIARQCLEKLTSGEAGELGTIKDDLALLTSDPRVIRLILDEFERRSHLTRYEASAFADVMALVKHPDFVPPTARLFQNEELMVRVKAVAAACTQADPSLTPALDRLMEELVAAHGDEGGRTRLEILEAALASGGDHAPVLIARALQDPVGMVRTYAAELAAQDGYAALAPRVLPLLQDGDRSVRLRAAWTLAAHGLREGEETLLSFLDPRSPGEALMAIQAVTEIGLTSAAPTLRRLLPHAGADLEVAFTLALVSLDDPEMIRSLRDIASDPEADRHRLSLALAGLACGGDQTSLPWLRSEARKGEAWRHRALAQGLSCTRGAPDEEVVEILLEGGELFHPGDLAHILPRLGKSPLPRLKQLLAAAELPSRAAFLVGCLGTLGTPEAREAILAVHARFPDLAEQQVRLLDLDRRRQGILR